MSVICDICGKEFKTSQGLRGHKTFVHQIAACHDAPALPATEQSHSIVEETLEHLLLKVEQLDSSLIKLVSKVDNQGGQINIQRVKGNNTQSDYRKLEHEISRCRHDLHQLDTAFQRLNRFVQYEFAGVEDNVIWELCQDTPELKKKVIKPK